MTFTEILETWRILSHKGLKSLGRLALAAMLIGLISCESVSGPNVSALNIYQPSTLRLIKNKPIQTVEGVYTPQTNEVWHSDARYRRLEREMYSK